MKAEISTLNLFTCAGAKTKNFLRRPLHGHQFAPRRYFNPKHPQIPLWIKLRLPTAPTAANSLKVESA